MIDKLNLYGPSFQLNDKINPFWTHTLKAYKTFCYKVPINNTGEWMAESIFLNENIKIDKKTLFNKNWISCGVTSISHLVRQDGQFLTLDEFSFKKKFAKSPIKRIGRERFIRNCCIAAGNSKNKIYKKQLKYLLDNEKSEIILYAANWANERLV